MSGTALLDGLQSLEEIIGAEALESARAALNPLQKEQLASATAVTWIPMTTSLALFEAAAKLSGRDADPLLDEVVRRTATRLMRGVWRMLLRLTSDDALVKRTPALYARGRNVGQLSARLLEPGRAEILLTGWPDVSDRQLRMISVSNAVILELAGRRGMQQTYARTRGGARFELHWRA